MKYRCARSCLRRTEIQPATSSAAAVALRPALTAGRKRRSTPPAPPRRMSSSHAMNASATADTTAVNDEEGPVRGGRGGIAIGGGAQGRHGARYRSIARGMATGSGQVMRRHQQATRCHGVIGARMAS
jgi:hypothetical protein